MFQKMFPVGPFQCNCVILGCEETKEAVVIDPGDEAPKIREELEASGMRVKYLLHTHAHLDHCGATGEMKKNFSAPVCLHKDDEPMYQNLPMQGQMFGIPMEPGPPVEKYLEDEEVLSFGKQKLEVLHTPGHSPGSVCFKLKDGPEHIYSGDTLFYRSIGRTDLWGGDTSTLLKSIRERLFVYEGEITVFPGHGPETRLGDEVKENPFLQ